MNFTISPVPFCMAQGSHTAASSSRITAIENRPLKSRQSVVFWNDNSQLM